MAQQQDLLTSRSAERAQKVLGFVGNSVLFLVTAASAAAILFILYFILRDALPFFREFGPGALFESTNWYPVEKPPSFGALGIFVGSGLVTVGSCVVAVPLGLAAAVCLSDVMPFGVRQVVKPLIELLAAIPSVVYGFFALVIFAPFLQNHGGVILAVAMWALGVPVGALLAIVVSDVATANLPDRLYRWARPLLGVALGGMIFYGLHAAHGPVVDVKISSGVNAMNASIILALMALPTIVSVCEDALSAVGRDLREGSYALGATRAETMVKVVIPAAKGGILAAVLLGVMRAVGETMVVLMAAGNSMEIPEPWYNLFSGVRTLTATIALEMGEAPHGGNHYHVLFAMAFCLLVFSFACNLLSEWAVRRSMRKD